MIQTTLFAMLKGGVRKSTSAFFTAWALAEAGEDVLVVDADSGTQGITDWTSRVYAGGGSVPFHVAQWSPRMGLLVPFIMERRQALGVSRVIIDVGGEAPEVLAQAARLADVVISPCGPEQAEMGRLEPTRSILSAEGMPPMVVLLTRVPVVGRGLAKSARDVLDSSGYAVAPVEIPHNREVYANPWGTVLTDLGAYGALAEYLRKMEVS